jgi:hypothetical protein
MPEPYLTQVDGDGPTPLCICCDRPVLGSCKTDGTVWWHPDCEVVGEADS